VTDSSDPLLDRAVLVDALRDLVRRLCDRGIPAGIRLVGAAAIALEYDHDRPATRDVDAYLHPREPILDVAAEIAAERGWKPDWLNTKAAMFQSHHDHPTADWPVVMQEGQVRLSVASPELLLAMKLLASRGSRDADDIATMLRICRVTSLEEAQAMFGRYYREEEIKPQGRRVIEAWLRGEPVHSD
jgi:hypothetical protein